MNDNKTACSTLVLYERTEVKRFIEKDVCSYFCLLYEAECWGTSITRQENHPVNYKAENISKKPLNFTLF